MKKIALITAAVMAVSGGAAAGASAAPVHAPGANATALTEFEGTVLSVNRSARTFRLRDHERGTVRIKVNRFTRFERLRGLSSLHRGLRNIEATVKRSKGKWVATEVERSGRDDRDDDRDDDRGGDDD
jgi:hypothetical protein